ncbi:MAG TPA: DNA polymerase III subunit gamma/tau [Gammaproteobacteria bacterium]|nr:DNA polymerase III subunit gamma/tau [Gammaproteobacteria bacterium]
MSYTVLALKWRPRRFADLVGQEHVVRALVNSLAENRLHHAYLFSGTRGVGKTTVARILAKALNCETGVVAEPCGVCRACVAIDEGRFIDLMEVDAASRTKVDDTRELLENVQYSPTVGRFKVYLIDEVHMLSNHSFNALLKTLEEPPPHVKFLFATTDPQKLPVTVLSRCLQFNLRKLTAAEIAAQLTRICAAETIAAEADGLKAIARAAEGSMRDALSLLDQAIAFGGGRIEAAAVNSMLGNIDRGHVLRMLESLSRQDGSALLREVDQLDQAAPDYGAVLDDIAASLQRLAVLQLVRGRLDDDEAAVLGPLAERLSPEDVQLYYQIAINGRRDLAVARDPRVGFEMTLLRMLAFRPPADADGPRASVPQPAAVQSRATAPAAERTAAPPRSDPSLAAIPSPATSHESPVLRSGAANQSPSPAEVDWPALLQSLDLRGPARQLADHCDLKSRSGSAWQLVLPPDKEHLNTQQLRARVEAALKEHFGRELKVTITSGAPQRTTPAELRKANENERMRAAREAIETDPNVRALQTAFDATLEADSIRITK